MRKITRLTRASLGFVVILALWQAGSMSESWNHFLLPAPGVVFRRMAALLANGTIAKHLLASLRRVFSGFAISVAAALPAGAALAFVPSFSAPVRPLLDFVRQIPPLAVVPLLILSLGIGEASKTAIVVMASFFPILMNVEGGIRHVDRRLLEVGEAMSFSKWASFRHIAFPAFFPYFFVGVRLALSYSWRSLIGAEIVAASSGLGYMIREAETLSRSDTIICGVLVLGFVGYVSDFALKKASGFLFPWSGRDGAE